jgi:hypothetical protein
MATQQMLAVVCGYRASELKTAMVLSPPANVRKTPNGNVLCSIKSSRMINIYGANGSWYYTDACGPIGVIHSSQVQF